MSPSTATADTNTALIPVPKLENDCYDWEERHAAVIELQKTTRPEIVLIGDSITHFWGGEPKGPKVNGRKAWEATFGNHAVLNMGFGWDRTQNVLWRLDHSEMDGVQPKTIVLNIGTNNFSETASARANSPEEIAAAIRAICVRLQAKSPTSRIIVMGVFPRGYSPTDAGRAGIKALNALLAADFRSDNNPEITFLDIGDRMLEFDGSISKEVLSDGTHPGEKGYEIWGNALREAAV